MTHKQRLVNSRHSVKHFFLHRAAIRTIGIDCKITHTEGSEVLEEMGALTGIDAITRECYLCDDTRH